MTSSSCPRDSLNACKFIRYSIIARTDSHSIVKAGQSLLLGEQGRQNFGQTGIAGLVEMKLILVPDSRGRLSVGPKQNGGEIDEGKVRIQFADLFGLSVETDIGFPFAHALGGGLAGEVDQVRFGKSLADAPYERNEISKDVLGGFSVPEVVLPAVEHGRRWLVAGEELLEVVMELGKLGTTETTVEHGDFNKVSGEGRPPADRGTAGEEGEVFRGGRVVLIELSESFEFLDETAWIVLGLSVRLNKGESMEDYAG